MKTITRLLAATAFLLTAGAANAADTIVNFSGSFAQAGAFKGQLTLDVVDGKAVSGTGTIDLLSYTGATLTMITTSTLGNEDNSKDYPGAPVGFRANDGTDYYALDQAYPISTNGLLFAVGTADPQPNANPLIALYSNGDGSYGAQFTGVVDDVRYYNNVGSLNVSEVAETPAVPEPATWAMMLVGFGVVGAGLRRRSSVTTRVRYTV